MIKIQKILDGLVSDFDIRISDFALLVFWRKRKWLR
jgi:hypothetical protein